MCNCVRVSVHGLRLPGVQQLRRVGREGGLQRVSGAHIANSYDRGDEADQSDKYFINNVKIFHQLSNILPNSEHDQPGHQQEDHCQPQRVPVRGVAGLSHHLLGHLFTQVNNKIHLVKPTKMLLCVTILALN